jgi:periplasmic divalent cation tolerance protein
MAVDRDARAVRLLVLSTAPSKSEAESIASAVVSAGLAACVNIVPGVTSIYRWKGAVERQSEQILLIKTRAEAFEDLRRAIVSSHSYEVPEVVACRIVSGHKPYLSWLDGSVARRRPSRGGGRREGPGRPRSRR